MTEKPSNGVLAELRALAREVGENHEWLDADELEDDETFARLVALLKDAEHVTAEDFATAARDGSKYLRAATLAAIADGRDAPPDWAERAKKRFQRADYGERLLLLRALALSEGKAIAAVLSAADEDWRGSPLAKALAEFLAARVARGERLSAGDFGRLGPGLQPLVSELIQEAGEETKAALGPAVEEWQRESIDVDFFKSLGRVVDPAQHPGATTVGSRAVAIDAIVAALAARPPRSLLLVGEQGVGKTTLIVEALRRLESRPWFAFQAGAAEVNAGQMYIGMLEGRVQEIVGHMARRAIAWIFPSFEEALWSGQHSQSPRGLLDALLPHVESGEATIVGEIDPLAYELLIQNRPRVSRLFDVIRLAPMGDDDALEVARGWAAHHDVDVDDATLEEALDLAAHYLPATASPGNLLRLLELVRDQVARGAVDEINPETVIGTLSAATGLPLHVLDPRAPLSLVQVRQFFEDRVLGQPEAVDCLVERIALVKAGLTDPTKPLGVFLFVGPTGTGKTEIAKAFSAFLFGSENRLVRLDMSEYQTPESLERLLGDAASGQDAAPLIASVRKQPFSVLLLDEFEKAHANVWDVFLQVFDDGRLTDRNGRTVDLRHCVIILTSNLGSAIPTGPGLGFAGERGAFDPASVIKSVERSFRPEFLNRLDRIVVFRPLGREIMRNLLEHELTGVLTRRGFRTRPWAVEWDEAAIDFLIEKGFSAELGARPLKRAIEQHLLTRLATTIVERDFPAGDQFLFITARDGDRLDVVFVDPDADDSAPAAPEGSDTTLTLARVALDPEGSPSEAAFLRGELESVAKQVETCQVLKEEALARTRESGFWESDHRRAVLSDVEYFDRLAAATATASRLAARLGPTRGTHSRELVGILARRLHVLAAALRGLAADEARDARLAIRPSRHDSAHATAAFVAELVSMYVSWADASGMRIRRASDANGPVLTVAGLGAYTLLRAEAGVHVLELPVAEDRSFQRVSAIVKVTPADAGERGPDDDLADGSEHSVVRRYRRDPSPLVRDASGARTGRIDRVLGGDFDLLSEPAPVS
jgi:ATP-dependent Clp protease ATP-binding subunit ClpC